jgi:hypothetical protein
MVSPDLEITTRSEASKSLPDYQVVSNGKGSLVENARNIHLSWLDLRVSYLALAQRDCANQC